MSDTYKTIEYITLPSSDQQEGGTYLIADRTWRNSPAQGIKQGDIIHWHKMQNLTLTSDDIGERIAPLNDLGFIPLEYLPYSYIDDVVEGYYNQTEDIFYKLENLTTPIEGLKGKIYIDLLTDKCYRCASSNGLLTYVLISGGTDGDLVTQTELEDAINTLSLSMVTEEQILTLIEETGGVGCTLQQVTVSSIAVSANDDYAFNIRTAIPSIEGYVPLSIAGYKLSAGEVSLNKLCLNEGYVEATGTILLNGESSFDITFDIYYVLETKFIPQAEEVGY